VVLGRETADLAPLIDQACAVGVLATSGRGLGFRHPLIRAALYEEMPAAVRAAWHRDAGRALAEAAARESAHAGRRDQARAVFAGAIEVYTALGATTDLARLPATPR
jgi:hypothetical protein